MWKEGKVEGIGTNLEMGGKGTDGERKIVKGDSEG